MPASRRCCSCVPVCSSIIAAPTICSRSAGRAGAAQVGGGLHDHRGGGAFRPAAAFRLFQQGDHPGSCWTAAVPFLAAAVGAFLTTYYSFRLIFIILFPDRRRYRANSGGNHGDRTGEHSMAAVLWCLAGVTVVLGFFQTPLHDFLAAPAQGSSAAMPAHHIWLPVAALRAGCMPQAWFEFGRKKPDKSAGWNESRCWPTCSASAGTWTALSLSAGHLVYRGCRGCLPPTTGV